MLHKARARRTSYDRKRNLQEWRHWYWTSRWRKRAKAQLAAEPLCAICLKAGRVTAATVADHVEPHRGDPVKFWEGELQSVCDEAPWRCHSSVKQREEGRLL
ncbi:hypothetical protein VE25_07440 [Devosia geojensis]|uniref:HNH endonuclease n=2 Tax=Devosia geojensis TaxID=443610 RepID=A0A0F5FU24_9HYPH|nr:hypothetical protein VE25_07440 [Devosia geojensis]